MFGDAPPPSVRVLAVGATGSGKTTRLRTLYAERLPRVLVLDTLGTEWHRWPSAVVCASLAEVRAALRTRAGASAWRIVWQVDSQDPAIDALVHWLTPRPRAPSFVRAIGGCALLCDEVDLLAGPSATAARRGLWQRGRHAGLSLLVGAQRLALVQRTVSAQSDVFVLCRQHEPTDLETLAGFVPSAVLADAARLARWETVVYRPGEQAGFRLDAAGRVTRRYVPPP